MTTATNAAPKPAQPEVWLRGPVDGVSPALQPAAHALLQAQEELHRTARDLPPLALWARPGGVASVGFHLRHAAGVIDRLLTYARGGTLDDAQRAALAAEGEPADVEGATADAASLLAPLDLAVARAIDAYRATDPATLGDARAVGRAGLPSTVLGLLFHAAEHVQRHAGQAGTTATIVRALYPVAPHDRERATADMAAIRALYDAYARRDAVAIAAASADDVETVQTPLLPWGGVHRGAAGARAFLAALVAHVDSTFTPERLVPAGDRVVAVGRTRGTAHATGAAFDVAAVHVWTLREGKVTRLESYVDAPAMLAALGR